MLGTLFGCLTWLMLLPESIAGSGLAVMILIGVLGLRRFTGVGPIPRANLGDIAAVTYVSVQLLVLIFEGSRPNTVHFLLPCVCALCIYFSMRLLPMGKATMTHLFRGTMCVGILLASANLILLVHGFKMAHLFPPSDLSALRASIPLLGAPTRNDGIMVVLAFLPYAMISMVLERRRNLHWAFIGLAATTALVMVLVLSFSRAVYLALAVLFIGWLLSAAKTAFLPFKEICVYCLTICAIVGISVRCLNVQHAVKETLFFNRTISQQRSTQGRETIWQESISQLEKHPILGRGGYTDGFNSLEWLNNSTLPFTARAYNAPLEAALSGGLLGLLAYASFLLYPMIGIAQTLSTPSNDTPSSPIPLILAAGIIAMIVKDLTYSSLVLHGATMVMAWATVALIQNSLSEETYKGIV